MKNIYRLLFIIICFSFFSFKNILSVNEAIISKQAIWFLISFLILGIMYKINIKYLIKGTYVAYVFLNLALLYLLIFGNAVNGSKAWISLGFISFQPSEFMKVILIVLLSILSLDEKYILKSIIITLIPAILTFLEPDTGNVIFYFVILLSVFLYKTKNIKRIIKYSLFGLILIVLGISLIYINSSYFSSLFGTSFLYRMDRLVFFFKSSSYQLNNALISIGTSGWFGMKSEIIYIPEAITDFAFSLLIANNGLVGMIIFLLLNFAFNFILLKEIPKSNALLKVIIFTFLCLKICQESIHMLMNIGLFPITGITLPFISYGGSSLMSYILMVGIILNIHKGSSLDCNIPDYNILA